MFNIENKAFSLIELSIVLIIIGLLVAGITGGASLIESARMRSFMNEIRNYEQAVFAFKATKDRLPGDLNKDGRFGEGAGEVYDSNSFPAPYNTNSNEYKIPGEWGGFFVDLYLEGLIDFEPKNSSVNNRGESSPYSKIYKNIYYYPWYFNETRLAESSDSKSYNYGKKLSNNIVANDINKKLNPEFFKNFDVKYDDGDYQNGRVRSNCELGYDEAIKNGKTCSFSIIEFQL